MYERIVIYSQSEKRNNTGERNTRQSDAQRLAHEPELTGRRQSRTLQPLPRCTAPRPRYQRHLSVRASKRSSSRLRRS